MSKILQKTRAIRETRMWKKYKEKTVRKGLRKYNCGYKVCRLINGKYVSAFGFGKLTEYKKGKKTKRNDEQGAFAVFGTYGQALGFVMSSQLVCSEDVVEIITCLYKESDVRSFYYIQGNIKIENQKIRQIPSGTKYADEVILINTIYTYI